LELKGSFDLKAKKEDIYKFFLDPNRIAKCLPDLQELKVKDSDNFDAKFKVGIAHIKGTVSFNFTIAEKIENQGAKLVGKGSGVGSVIDLTIVFNLEDLPDGITRVNWEADLKIGGMLAGIGSRLLSPITKKNTEQLIKNIKKEIGELP